MRRKNTYAFFVAVAVLALLTVSFVPHHHHNGFMCMAEEAVENVHGACCGGGCESRSESGEGHSEDRSNCIEDEVFLSSRSENHHIGVLPSPVQMLIAAVITDIADFSAADGVTEDFHDMPPCLYRSANIEGTFSLRAPPFLS